MLYNIDDTKVAGYIKRGVTLDRVTLKQGKTYCGGRLTTDQIVHVVMDVDVDVDKSAV